MYNHILSIILFTPLVGALVLLFVPKENKDAIRWIANIFRAGRFSDFAAAGVVVLGAAARAWLQVHRRLAE
jgi:NADH:ubiquinone oxidoreductase subunit 4 (subunit M)